MSSSTGDDVAILVGPRRRLAMIAASALALTVLGVVAVQMPWWQAHLPGGQVSTPTGMVAISPVNVTTTGFSAVHQPALAHPLPTIPGEQFQAPAARFGLPSPSAYLVAAGVSLIAGSLLASPMMCVVGLGFGLLAGRAMTAFVRGWDSAQPESGLHTHASGLFLTTGLIDLMLIVSFTGVYQAHRVRRVLRAQAHLEAKRQGVDPEPSLAAKLSGGMRKRAVGFAADVANEMHTRERNVS